ncbi:unnamed protein product [Lactuca saligna]|uniref:Uncharacterized protein n=1 Tax=Lactuca saligna TaxID=75948 RepID=A0AA36A2P2_LACSI|nr:unnamed protein product [Lactuca saligna]
MVAVRVGGGPLDDGVATRGDNRPPYDDTSTRGGGGPPDDGAGGVLAASSDVIGCIGLYGGFDGSPVVFTAKPTQQHQAPEMTDKGLLWQEGDTTSLIRPMQSLDGSDPSTLEGQPLAQRPTTPPVSSVAEFIASLWRPTPVATAHSATTTIIVPQRGSTTQSQSAVCQQRSTRQAGTST